MAEKNGSVLHGCRMHQFAQVIRKSILISEDPKLRNSGNRKYGGQMQRRLCCPGDYH